MSVYNRLHEYVSIVLKKKGLDHTKMGQDLGLDRRFAWNHTHRPMIVLGRRQGLLEKVARYLGEPMSRILWIAGFNPWAERLPSLQYQDAIWEFVERVVYAKEHNLGKPPLTQYLKLLNTIFGGAEGVVPMTQEEMVAYLMGQTDDADACSD